MILWSLLLRFEVVVDIRNARVRNRLSAFGEEAEDLSEPLCQVRAEKDDERVRFILLLERAYRRDVARARLGLDVNGAKSRPHEHNPNVLTEILYSSRRDSIARPSVTSSAYSSSPPTGRPLARRVTLIPSGLMMRER